MEQQRSGRFKKAKKAGYKVAGLTAEESKRATTLKGKKISAAQLKKANVLKDIGQTKFVKGQGVVGPGGKAFTGSVILASGSTATYVKGRRVGVSTKKAAPPRRNPTGNLTGKPTNDPPPTRPRGFKQAARRQEKAAVSRGGTLAIKTGLKPAQSSTTSTTNRRPMPKADKGIRPSTSRNRPTPGRNPLNWEPADWAAWIRQNRNKPKPKPKGYGRSGNKRYP